MRDFLSAVLSTAGVDPDDSDDILTATSEACANVVDHGGPGPRYHVRAWLTGARYRVEVSNTGPSFVAREVPVSGAGSESGRGIALMYGLVDQVQFAGLPEGGTVVTLHKLLSRPPSRLFRALPGPTRPAARRGKRSGRAPTVSDAPGRDQETGVSG